MALSIKNPQTEQLARELAEATGMTITLSVTRALEDALLKIRGRNADPSMQRALLDISDRCEALPDLDTRSADEILGYDEVGAFSR